jgi:cytidylate kinase
MRITLSGDLGSGKSSVGRRLSELLGIPYISAGQLFREIGQISNLDALATNLAAETNTDIDAAVDGRTRDLDRDVPDFIIDSRMAWHFVTNAVRVFLSVSQDTAIIKLRERRESEIKRYKKLYNAHIEDRDNYDLWIITDNVDIDQICKVIEAFALEMTYFSQWIPKSRIIPMISIREASGIRFSFRVNMGDRFQIPLAISNNYGAFFGGPYELISAFNYELDLVPFRRESPKFLGSSIDVVELAKRTVTESDLYDWEDAFGVVLAFHKLLKDNKVTFNT